MALGIVKTTYGLISGEEYGGDYTGITVFRGIPYGAPPIGRLRFAPPEDPESWEGIRACVKFGPAALQSPLQDRHAHEYYYGGFPEMSEDCLYLNVCSGAQAPGEKRPVYIWYHGGGLTNCYSYEIQFNPQELAKKGIVVVTVGHRLNLFGYLVLPQLDEEQGGRGGNYGFMDQIKALDWVTENIQAFGGDPDNITVGGQSGGSLKAIMAAVSPAGKKRVKRVISQSGLKWMIPFKSKEEAIETGKCYLRYVGLPDDISLEELRAIPAEQLFDSTAPRAVMPGDMVPDEYLIPGNSVGECLEQYQGTLDFLNTCNLGESDVFARTVSGLNKQPVRGFVKQIQSKKDFYEHFKNLLGPLYEKYDFEDLVSVTDQNAWFQTRKLAILGLAGSEGMNVSRNLMLNRMFGQYIDSKMPGSHVYNGLWSYMIPLTGEDVGTDRDCDVALAWHSTELWFVFNSLRKGTPPTRPWREDDFQMGKMMCSYWADFIASGNPNGEGLPYWPESNRTYGYLELNEQMKCREGLSGRLEQLIHEFVQKEYKLDW